MEEFSVKFIILFTQVFVVAVNAAVGLGVISIFLEKISDAHPFLEVTLKSTAYVPTVLYLIGLITALLVSRVFPFLKFQSFQSHDLCHR